MIAVGDKITVLLRYATASNVQHAVVTAVFPARTLFTFKFVGGVHSLRDEHEGLLWIHGHHDERSEEIAALRTARSLML